MVLLITRQSLHRLVGLTAALNIFFILGTWLHHSPIAVAIPNGLTSQLDLAVENVAASWYASMLLLLVAIMGWGCFLAERQYLEEQRHKALNVGWLCYASLFALLSFDEMGSFHETIGDNRIVEGLGGTFLVDGWQLFYIAIALAGAFMLLFAIRSLRRDKSSTIAAILGVLLLLSNPLQENYEIATWNNSADPTAWKRPILLLLMEEGSELFASSLFLFSFSAYLKGITREPAAKTIRLALPERRAASMVTIVAMLAAGLVMIAVKWGSRHQTSSAIGIAENWFPAAAAFGVSLIALHLHLLVKSQDYTIRSVYVALSVIGIGTSVFFGSNMGAWSGRLSAITASALWVCSVLAGIAALRCSKVNSTRIAIVVSLALVVLAIFFTDFQRTAVVYLALTACLLALILDYYDKWKESQAAA